MEGDGKEKADQAYIDAIRRLHYWLYGNSPNAYSNMVYTMFHRCDNKNRPNLARIFPVEYAAYLEWRNAPSEDAFFQRYGLKTIRTFLDEKS